MDEKTPVPAASTPVAEPARRRLLKTAAVAAGGAAVMGPAKIGRNDPCPCGSGKKYKHCHGQLA